MKIPKKDLKIESCKGKNKSGGQRLNKTETACRITHIPTGIQAYESKSYFGKSKKAAIKSIEQKVKEHFDSLKAQKKKDNRDYKIHNTPTIRTYNFDRGIVKDHRTKKTASIKDILIKGKIDRLY